ncbi:MAG: hypothetical protein CSA97_02070 [Bacteroidetes bacterium]|nr:MAG: hypothetical protein CSA97_02070 [Bacteroidota bacterium]
MTKFLPFFLDTEQFYTNQKCFVISGKHIEFLCAFLNSSLFKCCFRDNFPELQGGTRELSKVFFERIPVMQVDDGTNARFAKLVEDIQQEYTEEKYQQLDGMVIDLYALNAEELAHILRSADA